MARILAIALFLMAGLAPAYAAEMGSAELRAIVQAGGSLILDLDKGRWTANELAMLAANLKYNSTLTIKMSGKKLTAVQCAQIASASPGHVVFWF